MADRHFCKNCNQETSPQGHANEDGSFRCDPNRPEPVKGTEKIYACNTYGFDPYEPRDPEIIVPVEMSELERQLRHKDFLLERARRVEEAMMKEIHSLTVRANKAESDHFFAQNEARVYLTLVFIFMFLSLFLGVLLGGF